MSPLTWLFAFSLLVQGFLLSALVPIALKFLLPQTLDQSEGWLSAPVAFGVFQSLGLGYGLVLAKLSSLKTQTYSQLILWSVSFSFCFLFWPGGFGGEVAPLAFLLTTGLILLAASASEFQLINGFSQTTLPGAREPYFLLAAASLGALLAIVGYPLLIEPNFLLLLQIATWRWAYGAVGVLLIACGVVALRSTGPSVDSLVEKELTRPVRRSSLRQGFHWLVLSAIATSLYLGSSAYIATDVSPVPLISLSHLAIYVFALIAAFARPSLAGPRAVGFEILVKGTAAFLTLAGVFCFEFITSPALQWSFYASVAVALIFMFQPHRLVLLFQPLGALVAFFLVIGGPETFAVLVVAYLHLLAFLLQTRMCFGEQSASRPDGKYFPEFVMWMGLGVFIGSVFNSWLAPRLFDLVIEYPLALMLACMLRPNRLSAGFLDRIVFQRFGASWSERRRRSWTLALDLLVPVLIGALGMLYFSQMDGKLSHWTTAIPLLVCLATVGRPVRFGLSLGSVYLAHHWLVAASWPEATRFFQ